jgi:hypothetical protein
VGRVHSEAAAMSGPVELDAARAEVERLTTGVEALAAEFAEQEKKWGWRLRADGDPYAEGARGAWDLAEQRVRALLTPDKEADA